MVYWEKVPASKPDDLNSDSQHPHKNLASSMNLETPVLGRQKQRDSLELTDQAP